MSASFQVGLFRTVGTVVADCRAVVHRLRHDKSGNVAMMFGLLAIPLFGIMGLAVDMGRAYHVGVHTQGALDSAALAAGRVAQIEKVNMIDKASKAASAYYDQAAPTDVVKTSIVFAPNSQNTEFTVTATSWVRTPFLSLLKHIPGAFKAAEGTNIPEACKASAYECVKLTSKATAQICLNCSSETSGEDGSHIELSLMLDVTGSMAGQRITDLKKAAKDLVEIIVWSDQSKWKSRVALVPFANAVNAGPYFSKITNMNDKVANDPKGRNIHYEASCFQKNGKVNTTTCPDSEYNTIKHIAKNAPCIVERERAGGLGVLDDLLGSVLQLKGTLGENTDDAPKASGSTPLSIGTKDASLLGVLLKPLQAILEPLNGKSLPSWNLARSQESNSGDRAEQMSTACDVLSVNAIVPLTSDLPTLTGAIANLQTGGSTAGHLGTAFAWYMLSPKWNDVWPEASRPTPYGTPNVKKIAILMMDGEFNTLHGHQYSDGSTQAVKAASTTKTLCDNMKGNPAKGTPVSQHKIEIYTVGFQVNSTAEAMLKYCAADANHYYNTPNGDALRTAFRDIALKISKLRLTN